MRHWLGLCYFCIVKGNNFVYFSKAVVLKVQPRTSEVSTFQEALRQKLFSSQTKHALQKQWWINCCLLRLDRGMQLSLYSILYFTANTLKKSFIKNFPDKGLKIISFIKSHTSVLFFVCFRMCCLHCDSRALHCSAWAFSGCVAKSYTLNKHLLTFCMIK